MDSSRSVIRVLYTFSCDISHTLLSTGFKSGQSGGHIVEVALSDSAIVVPA